jgi:predicted nucleic acid-binding protein
MSWHAVAETWSVLTRLPPPLALPGEEARIVLEKLRRVFTVVEPKGAIYESALLRCSAAGASSGAVFDAIHLVIAEEAGADVLLTFNAKDFLRLSVEKSPRILTPPDPPELAVDR